jgi:hypothetical protein
MKKEQKKNTKTTGNTTKTKRSRSRSKSLKTHYSRETRPSPSTSAATQHMGTILTGNDGGLWQVKANKNGIHRWVKK